MLETWRREWAVRKIKPGDGRPLPRFRFWQLLSRSLLHLHLPGRTGPGYAVDVRRGGDSEGRVWADLYRDGRRYARATVPAVFPVPGGRLEVATSTFGLRRAHFVADDGTEHQLVPDPRSAEGRRARLDRRHPVLSRWIGVVSVLAVLVGVGLNLLQLAEPVSQIPPVTALVGTFESPVRLPLWANVALGLAAALGSTERALRLRYRWYLDAVGN
ncbi:hypothetical protein DT076_01445 [Desertihabitans brevis]|uniref:Uncharacterized protein n=1 Tax=Desertihabitans brevis TaxID=2268447 RepID=A0A367Z1P8_9ACTN|nr:hypothetical protein [Desertihabitans brevis]RCK71151.1 hypothetical protein DT076_01445 [Desertihabitans brevis]